MGGAEPVDYGAAGVFRCGVDDGPPQALQGFHGGVRSPHSEAHLEITQRETRGLKAYVVARQCTSPRLMLVYCWVGTSPPWKHGSA